MSNKKHYGIKPKQCKFFYVRGKRCSNNRRTCIFDSSQHCTSNNKNSIYHCLRDLSESKKANTRYVTPTRDVSCKCFLSSYSFTMYFSVSLTFPFAIKGSLISANEILVPMFTLRFLAIWHD